MLSGFVLCWGFFRTGEIQKLKIAFFKRLPRLIGPVLISVIASYLLFHFGLYYFYEASKISGSPWLATFAYAGWTPEFQPSIHTALIQGLTTFINGDASYNTNLWTMKPEFIGSIFVFTLGAFISLVLSYDYLFIVFFLFATWTLSTYSNLFPFVLGIFLAAIFVKHDLKIRIHIALTSIALGLYLLGYSIPEKNYLWVSHIQHPRILVANIQIILNSIGSGLVIFSIMSNLKIYELMNGKIYKYLGQLSFPLYLVHTLVICSISSYSYCFLKQENYSNQATLIILFGLTFTVSLLAAMPLIFFDKHWLNLIDKIIKRFLI